MLLLKVARSMFVRGRVTASAAMATSTVAGPGLLMSMAAGGGMVMDGVVGPGDSSRRAKRQHERRQERKKSKPDAQGHPPLSSTAHASRDSGVEPFQYLGREARQILADQSGTEILGAFGVDPDPRARSLETVHALGDQAADKP